MVTPNTQAAKAAAQGGVTSFADNEPQKDGIQLASGSLLLKFLQKSGKIRGKVSEGERVPEPATEGLLPTNPTTDKQTTYTKQKQKLQDEVLSPAGKQRLEQAGGDTGTTINMPIDPEDRPVPRLDLDRDVTQTAKKAVNEQPTGLADEGDAEDLLAMQDPDMLIDTQTGVDFNFDKMSGGEDINRTINAMSEIIKNPTEAAKRGVQTNQETLARADELLADEVGLTKTLLNKKAGQLLNAEEMTAVRMLMQKSAEKLTDLAQQIRNGDDSSNTLLKFRRQMAIHAGIQMKAKGAQTEIARALQAFKIPTDAEIPVETLNAMVIENGGRDHAKNLAIGYLKTLDEQGQVAANKFAFQLFASKTKAVWMEVYINGLLSYLPTHIKNGFGTPIFMAYNLLADTLAATGGSAARGLGVSQSSDGVYFQDIFARSLGYKESIADAWVVAGNTFRSEQPVDMMNKIEAANMRAIDSETLGINNNTAAAAVDHLGKLIRIPGRALMAADDFWRVINGRGELYEQAVRQLRNSKDTGKVDQDALDDALLVLLDPRFKGDELDKTARYHTMTDEIPGALGKMTNAFRSNFFGQLMLPFAKAPTNTIRRVAENHPVAAFLSKNVRDNMMGRNGARAQQRQIGRYSLAMGTYYTMYQFAIDGRLTGSLPMDEQSRKMLPKGWQPYSFVFIGSDEQREEAGLKPFPKDADGDPLPMYNKATGLPNGELMYISYQGLEPVSAFLGIAASTAQKRTMFYNPDKRLGLFEAGALATMEYFRDLPMLQGVSDVFKAFTYHDPSYITDGALGGTFGVLPLPYSSAVRNINGLTDTERKFVERPLEFLTLADVERMYEAAKDSDNPYDEIPYELVGTVRKRGQETLGQNFQYFQDQFLNRWENQIMKFPYFEPSEEDLVYQYDMLGNKRERGLDYSVNPMLSIWNNLTPFDVSFSEDIPFYKSELMRLGAPLRISKETYAGIKLDPNFVSDWTYYAKNVVALPTGLGGAQYEFRDYLQVMMGTGNYQNAKDEDKIRMIQRAENKFYDAAFPFVRSLPEHKQFNQAFSTREEIQR